MTGLLIVSHLVAIAVGVIVGGAYTGLKVRQREIAAEHQGMLARVIAHDPLEARRLAEEPI